MTVASNETVAGEESSTATKARDSAAPHAQVVAAYDEAAPPPSTDPRQMLHRAVLALMRVWQRAR